jgi:soluble lytic murein transglycosylase-like protein
MGALTQLIPAVLLLATTPAKADEVARWRPFTEEASRRFGVPNSWIERVIRAESRGLTTLNGRPIRSFAGAMGLMQLMPATWAEVRARLSLGSSPDDPHDNILAGTFFLRLMYDRFGYPGLFGAYNAGAGAYAAFLTGRKPLPSETIAYLASVGSAVEPAAKAPGTAPPPSLFIVRRNLAADRLPADRAEEQPLMFAVRKVFP